MTIAGKRHPRAAQFDRVKRVQELLLSCALVGDKPDVVDRQQVEATQLAAKRRQPAGANCFEELVGELLAGQIQHRCVWSAIEHLATKALQQVCFAHAASAVQKQRAHPVVFVADDAACGSEGQLVAGTHDEIVEAVFERCRTAVPSCGRGRCAACLARGGSL